MAIKIADLPIKNGDFPVNVYQRVATEHQKKMEKCNGFRSIFLGFAMLSGNYLGCPSFVRKPLDKKHWIVNDYGGNIMKLWKYNEI